TATNPFFDSASMGNMPWPSCDIELASKILNGIVPEAKRVTNIRWGPDDMFPDMIFRKMVWHTYHHKKGERKRQHQGNFNPQIGFPRKYSGSHAQHKREDND
ncbi:MAG TPA: hypothetical protein VMV77_04080, partial [Bacteroidales bacterium]|nr:hypothetical protein [Bacteroidales bacterium]